MSAPGYPRPTPLRQKKTSTSPVGLAKAGPLGFSKREKKGLSPGCTRDPLIIHCDDAVTLRLSVSSRWWASAT